MTTFCASTLESFWPIRRPTTSTAPPGATGTTRRMGRSGYAAAHVAAYSTSASAAANRVAMRCLLQAFGEEYRRTVGRCALAHPARHPLARLRRVRDNAPPHTH